MSTSVEARRAIEAILMVADQPIEPNLLAQVCEISAGAVEQICAELAASYEAENRGFVLARVAGGYRYQSHPDLAPYIERFVLDGQSARLSAAALETLAIVAYKQPISRAQVASIRGVSVDGVMKTLQGRGYITEVGRDPGPGNAVLFGTTPVFLERLGLNSVDDLPALGAFVPGADVVEQLERTLRVSDDPNLAPPAVEQEDAPSGPAEPAVAEPAVAEDPAAPADAVADADAVPADAVADADPAAPVVAPEPAASVVAPEPAAPARPDLPPTPPPPPGGGLREAAAAGFPGGGAEGFAGGETGGFAGTDHRPNPTSDPVASASPDLSSTAPNPTPVPPSHLPPGPGHPGHGPQHHEPVPPPPATGAPPAAPPTPGAPAHPVPEPPQGSGPHPGPPNVASPPGSTPGSGDPHPAPSPASRPTAAGGSVPGAPSAAGRTDATGTPPPGAAPAGGSSAVSEGGPA